MTGSKKEKDLSKWLLSINSSSRTHYQSVHQIMYTWLGKIELESSAWWICPSVSKETGAGLHLFRMVLKWKTAVH